MASSDAGAAASFRWATVVWPRPTDGSAANRTSAASGDANRNRCETVMRIGGPGRGHSWYRSKKIGPRTPVGQGGPAARPTSSGLALVRPLHGRHVDLLHAQHRVHCPGRPDRLFIPVVRGNVPGDDLPGETVPILEPAALLRLRVAALGQLGPVVVDLLLRIAADDERDGFIEREHGPAVERHERLAIELERDGEDRSRGPAVHLLACLAVAGDHRDLRILEHAHVEPRGLFCLVREPQARAYSLSRDHCASAAQTAWKGDFGLQRQCAKTSRSGRARRRTRWPRNCLIRARRVTTTRAER